MADAVIGRGYLQVVPKMDGDALGTELSKSGKRGSDEFSKSFSGGMSAKTVALGNIMSSALMSGVQKASSAASSMFVDAFSNFSTFEQLSGGVEKIFDEMDNSKVFADANRAWEDLNMSANQYLASINDVGAMFSATMGDEAAYDTARRGMKAISDYSSGTGKNLDLLNQKFAMITRATSSYQSIADQFSGILPATSKDFLEQAQAAGLLSTEYKKLTDVPIDEYQKALVGMLEQGTEQLGLAGNTAAETAETISGSIAGMQAAWSNFLTGIADENADMGQLTDNLVTSIGYAVDNVLPRVHEIFDRLGPALSDAVSGVLHDISPEWGDLFDKVAEGAGRLAEGLGRIVEQAEASGVLDAIADGILNIADAIASADFGPIFNTIGDFLGKLNEGAQFLKDMNLDAAIANGGMYADMLDPSTWHEGDAAVKNFQKDLEALGTTVNEYGRLSDATMRTVADAYRTNGNDMTAALAAAGLEVDSTTGKIQKMNSIKLEEKRARVNLEDDQLVDAQGHVYTWNGTELLDRKGEVVVDQVELIDAQGNIKEWNGTSLDDKYASVHVDDGGIWSVINAWEDWNPTTKVVEAIGKTMGLDAAGGFLDLHATGGFVTNGVTYLGRDANGVGHIAGEAGREWVMRHADGTTSIVPIENRKYLKPYAEAIASMLDGTGTVINLNLAYDASDDAAALARGVARKLGAIMDMRG